ncbi:MAG: nucleotidyltransferase domain-containing protein [Armatimonadota bacterium]
MPLIQSIMDLFQAEEDRSGAIVDALRSEIDEAVSVILYGSEARGEAEAGSDTDLLIVVKERSPALDEHIDEVCLDIAEEYSLALSWHIADLDDLREWDETDSDFWEDILRDGIRLCGETIEGLRRQWQTGRVS